METPYDEMYDIKQETTRKEQTSTIMASLHTIPKKVADVAQAQGVTEKFLAQGMPSGVINPSLLAHDRYLSAVDAIQDSIILTLLFAFMPLLPFNWFTGVFMFFILAYWTFHLAWWEKTRTWAIKGSSKSYINNTYRVYWIMFFLLMLPTTMALFYFVFVLGGEMLTFSYINSALGIFNGAERSIAEVFGNNDFIKENLSLDPQHQIDMDRAAYEKYFIIIFSIFAATTIASKILFTSKYKVEKQNNADHSKEEMYYAGEHALNIIEQERK